MGVGFAIIYKNRGMNRERILYDTDFGVFAYP
jgi:hypothetical protein